MAYELVTVTVVKIYNAPKPPAEGRWCSDAKYIRIKEPVNKPHWVGYIAKLQGRVEGFARIQAMYFDGGPFLKGKRLPGPGLVVEKCDKYGNPTKTSWKDKGVA